MLGLLHAWVLFPLVLSVLSFGCGLLVERIAGGRLPGVLVLPVGFAATIVTTELVTAVSATARFAVAVVVALAVAGLALGLPERRRPGRWVVGSVLLVFAAYAAPVVLSGQATFAGYVKLDDTATWLALADQVLQHGRALQLAPSTYSRTLQEYIADSGYPVGSVLPLGVGGKLVGEDIAWVFQPYLAYQAAMLALCFHALLGGLVRSTRARALIAFVAAQPALLYAYALWGAVKELVTVPLIALLVVLGIRAVRERTTARGTFPLAVAGAALLGVLNVGAGVWLALSLLPALLLVRVLSVRMFAARAGVFVAALGVLALPTIITANSFFNAGQGVLTSGSELGNLIHPLSVLQIVGIWPMGDFRLRPHDIAPTGVLIAVTCAAALIGAFLALRKRNAGLAVYLAVSLIGAAILASFGSPWVDAKALATASPALLLAGMTGTALLYQRGNRIEAVLAAAAIVFGVAWSNVLAYRAVWLAPRDQLGELESIGKRFAGDGPTLLNEYQPYGGRHFLRQLDPESSGELRYRAQQLRGGTYVLVPKGGYADIDEFQLPAVLVYRTLVLPRSPIESRPPSLYALAWRGRFYDVWQQSPVTPGRIVEHLSLGNATDNVAVPMCKDVLRLGREAAAVRGRLRYVPRTEVDSIDLSKIAVPPWLGTDRDPRRAGTLTLQTAVSGGTFGVWLGGSFAGRLTISVDGREVGSQRHRNEHPGQYVPFGTVSLQPGVHTISLHYFGPDLHPGSDAQLYASIDRVVLARTTEDVPFETIAPDRARSLCGRTLDWIEATT